MKFKFTALLAASLLLTGTLSHASTSGYTDYVTTAFGGTGSWSIWDQFPQSASGTGFNFAAPFSNLAGTSGTSGAGFTYTFTGGTPGPLLFPDAQGTANGTLYTGGAASTFTLSGSAVTAVDTLFLQIKQTIAMGTTPGLEGFGAGIYQPQVFINGLAVGISSVDSNHTDPFTEGSAIFSTTSWEFDDLNIAAGSTFSVVFSIPGGSDGANHQQLDGYRLDADGTVAAVPEPSTYALMAMGTGVILWSLRRRARPGLN